MITLSTWAAVAILFFVSILGVIAGGLFVLLTLKNRKTANEPQPGK